MANFCSVFFYFSQQSSQFHTSLISTIKLTVFNLQGCDSSFKSGTEFSSSSKKWPELKDLQFL